MTMYQSYHEQPRTGKFTHKWCERCYIRTFQVSRKVRKTWLVELLENVPLSFPSTSLQIWHRPTASPCRLHKYVFWLQAQRGAVERRYPSLAWFAPDVQSLAGAARPGTHWWSKVQTRGWRVSWPAKKKSPLWTEESSVLTKQWVEDNRKCFSCLPGLCPGSYHTWSIRRSMIKEKIIMNKLKNQIYVMTLITVMFFSKTNNKQQILCLNV